ncbi:hypothetical protein PR048_008948 [Dryococelus australis]|uniref:Uncharacterized protein n=1 Tax=Dryococelus australis TaxID=614101 RepID=A0ABQ9HZF7_9NEOP|nr:hypothetical protein PR048_008948 [Dryococelus australis]
MLVCISGTNAKRQEAVKKSHYFINTLPRTVTHLIVFSGNCGVQNKSHLAIKFWLYVVNKTHLEPVDHKFLFPGHSYNHCDRDFAMIHNTKRNWKRGVFVLNDWSNIIVQSNRNFLVKNMMDDDFLPLDKIQPFFKCWLGLSEEMGVHTGSHCPLNEVWPYDVSNDSTPHVHFPMLLVIHVLDPTQILRLPNFANMDSDEYTSFSSTRPVIVARRQQKRFSLFITCEALSADCGYTDGIAGLLLDYKTYGSTQIALLWLTAGNKTLGMPFMDHRWNVDGNEADGLEIWAMLGPFVFTTPGLAIGRVWLVSGATLGPAMAPGACQLLANYLPAWHPKWTGANLVQGQVYTVIIVHKPLVGAQPLSRQTRAALRQPFAFMSVCSQWDEWHPTESKNVGEERGTEEALEVAEGTGDTVTPEPEEEKKLG